MKVKIEFEIDGSSIKWNAEGTEEKVNDIPEYIFDIVQKVLLHKKTISAPERARGSYAEAIHEAFLRHYSGQN